MEFLVCIPFVVIDLIVSNVLLTAAGAWHANGVADDRAIPPISRLRSASSRYMPLPIVLARGEGAQALKLIEAAKKDGIPRIRYAWLARTLYSVGREGRPISRVTLMAVAAVYRALEQFVESHGAPDEAIELGSDPDDPKAYFDSVLQTVDRSG